MPPSPQDALLHEFAAYYTADELPGFIDDHLLDRGGESADRLVHILGDDAAELPGLLREMAADPGHPLLETIGIETQFDWNGDLESWAKFQQLARHIADRIDAA
jgi:hypothetical protein